MVLYLISAIKYLLTNEPSPVIPALSSEVLNDV